MPIDEKDLPEWYQIVKNVLREYECFSLDMFNEVGGPAAYSQLRYAAEREAARPNKVSSGHTVEEDFAHFLSYSGKSNRPDHEIALLREAYEAAWEPAIPFQEAPKIALLKGSSITIYGASDDLIEIEGDIREEFNWIAKDGESRQLAFSDGTLLRVWYDDDGIWRLSKVAGGQAQFTKEEGDVEKDTPDKVILSGVEIKWILFGKQFALSWRIP